MKKEKTIKAHTRKTKSGKTVNVRQHKASYEAAEDIVKDALRKKKGAGEELASRMKKEDKYEVLGVDLSELTDEQFKDFAEGFFAWDEKGKEHVAPTTRAGFKRFCEKWYSGWEEKQNFKDGWEEYRRENLSKEPSSPRSSRASYSMGFTKDEFKEWYEGTGSAADKRVEKILRKKLGKRGYERLNDEAADTYKKGGADKFFSGFEQDLQERRENGPRTTPRSRKKKEPIVVHSDEEMERVMRQQIEDSVRRTSNGLKRYKFKSNVDEATYQRELARRLGVSETALRYHIEGPYGSVNIKDVKKGELAKIEKGIMAKVDIKSLPKLRGDAYAIGSGAEISYERFTGGSDIPSPTAANRISSKAIKDLDTLRAAGYGAHIQYDGNYEYIIITGTPVAKKGKRVTANRKARDTKLTSRQARAVNALLNQPGWNMESATRYVKTLSDKELDKIRYD